MNSPSVGMKTNRNAASDARDGQRKRDPEERLQPARAEVARRLEQPPVEALERDEDRQCNEWEPDVAEHEQDGEPRVDERERLEARSTREDAVDRALVAEEHLPGEYAQEVAREERRDEEEQEDVLPLRSRQGEVVRERIRERDDDRRDDQRHLHGLPEQAQVDAKPTNGSLAEEVPPPFERERMRPRHDRERVDAVRRRRSRSGRGRRRRARATGMPSRPGPVRSSTRTSPLASHRSGPACLGASQPPPDFTPCQTFA